MHVHHVRPEGAKGVLDHPAQLDVTPPGSSPWTTLISRGLVYVIAVSRASSDVTHRRPILWATAAVVPEPP